MTHQIVHHQDGIFCTIGEDGFIIPDELWLSQRNTKNHAQPLSKEGAKAILDGLGVEYRWVDIEDTYESEEAAMENELFNDIMTADYNCVDYDTSQVSLQKVLESIEFAPIGLYNGKLYIGGSIWLNDQGKWVGYVPGDSTAFYTFM